MAYEVKGAPFRFDGAVNVENCETSKDVIETAGLNWSVAKCDIYGSIKTDDSLNNEYIKVPNRFGIYRTDINLPLGTVKKDYEIVQNIDAFKFFDDAIGKDKAIWQTAGSFGNGERIFVSAKLPNDIIVNGKDAVENYLVFTTGHDGLNGVKILFTPIRVVCQNSLMMAIKRSTNYVSYRHSSKIHSNLEIAKTILGISENISETYRNNFNYMITSMVDDNYAINVFANVVLTDNDITNIKNTGHNIKQIIYRNENAISDAKISTRKVNILAGMHDYYFNGIGQQEIVGTKYGVFNAITGYYSNVANSDGIKRMDSLLYGDKSNKIKTAGNILLAA